MGNHLRAGLRKLAETHDIIGDVRGHGLFTAVEFVSDRDAKTPARDAVPTVWGGRAHNFRPTDGLSQNGLGYRKTFTCQ